jgi:hypothetical protein
MTRRFVGLVFRNNGEERSRPAHDRSPRAIGRLNEEKTMNRIIRPFILAALAALSANAVATALRAQAGAETFSATASVKGPQGAITAPVAVVIERYTTDAERSKALEALKAGGTAALRQALEAMPAIGHIEAGQRRSPIKYAYARPVGAGRLVTVISDKPIAYLGEKLPNPKAKAGYDLAFALLNLPASGKGSGELGPAVKVRIDAGAIVTEDYAAEVVTLTDVEQKK